MTNPPPNSDPAAEARVADASGGQAAPVELVTGKILTPEAQRALAEAEARRKALSTGPERPAEFGGQGGPDPVRYGDWEKGGIASDF